LLLVEDHPDTAKVMARLLRNLGHEVTTAHTVAATLDVAQSQQFDLVLSDLGLPDGSGLELMRELGQKYGLRGVAISGYGMDEDLAQTERAGFFAHLTKPVNFQQVQAVLSQFAVTNGSRG
jgi:CheY-like chemotaxis protein